MRPEQTRGHTGTKSSYAASTTAHTLYSFGSHTLCGSRNRLLMPQADDFAMFWELSLIKLPPAINDEAGPAVSDPIRRNRGVIRPRRDDDHDVRLAYRLLSRGHQLHGRAEHRLGRTKCPGIVRD